MITPDTLINIFEAYFAKVRTSSTNASGDLTNIVDAEDTAAETTYFPSALGTSMEGFSALSLTGKLTSTGTITMTIEATNDEEAITADWVQIYGYDNKNDTMVNSLTLSNATLTFALLFNGLNYNKYRIKLVDSASVNTYIVKARRVY